MYNNSSRSNDNRSNSRFDHNNNSRDDRGSRDGRPSFNRDRKPFGSRDDRGSRDGRPSFNRDRKPFGSRDGRPSFDRDRKPFGSRDDRGQKVNNSASKEEYLNKYIKIRDERDSWKDKFNKLEIELIKNYSNDKKLLDKITEIKNYTTIKPVKLSAKKIVIKEAIKEIEISPEEEKELIKFNGKPFKMTDMINAKIFNSLRAKRVIIKFAHSKLWTKFLEDQNAHDDLDEIAKNIKLESEKYVQNKSASLVVVEDEIDEYYKDQNSYSDLKESTNTASKVAKEEIKEESSPEVAKEEIKEESSSKVAKEESK